MKHDVEKHIFKLDKILWFGTDSVRENVRLAESIFCYSSILCVRREFREKRFSVVMLKSRDDRTFSTLGMGITATDKKLER